MELVFALIFLINALTWTITSKPTAAGLAIVAASICILANAIKNKDLSSINKNRFW